VIISYCWNITFLQNKVALGACTVIREREIDVMAMQNAENVLFQQMGYCPFNLQQALLTFCSSMALLTCNRQAHFAKP
jgi:uncharacterized protein YjfI (DUF2170 family)